MAKKSFYIFLTSILGALLFLIINRIIIFIYLYCLAAQILSNDINFYQFAILDFFSLVLFVLGGAWYGVWLGLYWFNRVYEEGSHRGFVHHVSEKVFFPKPTTLGGKMVQVKEKLEKDLWQLEDIAKVAEMEVKAIAPIKRRVVRKRAPKKLNSTK